MIYIPGALIELPAGRDSAAAILIKRTGEILFDGKTYTAASMEQLRQDLKGFPATPSVKSEPGAPRRALDEVRKLFQIYLPTGASFAAADGPHVVLAVNFRGQCFFEDQMVSEEQLKTRLREAVADARRHSKELTLILYADKETANRSKRAYISWLATSASGG